MKTTEPSRKREDRNHIINQNDVNRPFRPLNQLEDRPFIIPIRPQPTRVNKHQDVQHMSVKDTSNPQHTRVNRPPVIPQPMKINHIGDHIEEYPAINAYLSNPQFKKQYTQNQWSSSTLPLTNPSIQKPEPIMNLERKITLGKDPTKNKKSLINNEPLNIKTNIGNTNLLMMILSEIWIFNLFIILGCIYLLTFYVPQGYTDTGNQSPHKLKELWVDMTWYKIGAFFPLPYTIICFLGLILPFRTSKFIHNSSLKKRRIDNLYILTVTKGDNKESVYRSWNAHKHLEFIHRCIRVHVLTDEPYFFDNINCYSCPKSFKTCARYKARALEWYRQTMKFTEHDWVLHLDEESVIDDESIKKVLKFIWYEKEYSWGQGLILYNQHGYWNNWFYTVADALRVGDDLSRFALQYSYFHRPVFGAHGSFLLVNGLVENDVTWNLNSLTEDYQFAVKAWEKGYLCGKVPGIIREQSPQTLLDFLKQRRRWFAGIIRLPYLLPKIWAVLWIVGSITLFGTILAIITSILYKAETPRWFGLVKDFTAITYVYLYLIGIFVQDIDRGVFPVLILIRLVVSLLFIPFASLLECTSVFYGLFFPPKDFDIIKK